MKKITILNILIYLNTNYIKMVTNIGNEVWSDP